MAISQEKVASVFDTVANYVEALEGEVQRYKEAAQQEVAERTEKEAQELLTRLQARVGEDVDPDLAKKIAASEDDNVKKLINKLASLDEVDSLGRAHKRPSSRTEKTASADKADADFADWILNG